MKHSSKLIFLIGQNHIKNKVWQTPRTHFMVKKYMNTNLKSKFNIPQFYSKMCVSCRKIYQTLICNESRITSQNMQTSKLIWTLKQWISQHYITWYSWRYAPSTHLKISLNLPSPLPSWVGYNITPMHVNVERIFQLIHHLPVTPTLILRIL